MSGRKRRSDPQIHRAFEHPVRQKYRLRNAIRLFAGRLRYALKFR